MKSPFFCLAVLPPLLAAPAAIGGQDSLEDLQRRCDAAREAKLAPLREAAIEECVATRRSNRTREDCERIYSDFGETAGTATGGVRPRMFNDLPECLEYFEAQNARGRSRSRR
jgi:hypothetical protein